MAQSMSRRASYTGNVFSGERDSCLLESNSPSPFSKLSLLFQSLWSSIFYAAIGFAAKFIRKPKARLAAAETAAGARKRFGFARINTALIFILASGFLFAFSIYRVGLEVILDGESIGFVSNQSIIEDSLTVVSSQAEDILGRSFSMAPDISYRFSIVRRNQVFNAHDLETGLLQNIPDIDRLSVLMVDNAPIAAARTPAELHETLTSILAEYPTTGQLSFTQDVSIQSRLAPLSLIREPDELHQILTHSHAAGASLLSVKHVEQISYSEPIPYETETQEDSSLWEGETRVISPGIEGESLVMAQQTSIDGELVESEITGSITLSEPVAEVVAVGTRHRRATGNFIRPANGAMTSGWGMRALRGLTRFHYGFDYRGNRGDPIFASDGGVVSFVGWQNGYGNTVIINHGNGYSTLYAHILSFRVTVGQRVGQGERIADIGNTGRSFGYHVHFEIRRNGVARDPGPYLR